MPRGGGCRRRTASGKAGRRSAGRGAPTPPAGRPSTTWSTVASTGCGATERRVGRPGIRRRRGAGGAGRGRPPPRPDAAGEGAPRAPRRRLTGASTGEPAHGRSRPAGPGPACPREALRRARPGSREAGLRRIRPDPRKHGFSGRHYIISKFCASFMRRSGLIVRKCGILRRIRVTHRVLTPSHRFRKLLAQ